MDDADHAQQRDEVLLESAIHATRNHPIPKGEEGDCSYCGNWSPRIVNKACAPCRDRYGLE